MPDNDILANLLLGGLGGYSLSKANYAGWESFIKVAEERLSHLIYFKVIIPVGLFVKIPLSKQWYAEGFRSYIFGLPNASLPMLFKSMEMALKEKYSEVENKKPDKLSNGQLITWAEQFLKENTEIAQGLRILRNILQHENSSIKEQQSIDAIRYISEMLNLLYPYDEAKLNFTCLHCGKQNSADLKSKDNFLGNTFNIVCSNCRNNIQFRNII
ncbi:Uncharacterised protein [Candidatus Tiddalikarchaeum anstoanum]|nr:Uncharacterised protein [Candidatus Tiddalikarchaeum anstoanum]